jgi:hypothetical protein
MAATTTRRRRPPSHGGSREGAGRKRLDGLGGEMVAVRLTSRQIARIQAWQEENGLETFSDALRSILDAVAGAK